MIYADNGLRVYVLLPMVISEAMISVVAGLSRRTGFYSRESHSLSNAVHSLGRRSQHECHLGFRESCNATERAGARTYIIAGGSYISGTSRRLFSWVAVA